MTGFNEADHQQLKNLKAAIDQAQAPDKSSKEENQGSDHKTAQTGYEFLGSVIGGIVLGWGADEALGSAPVGLLIGAVLGFVAGAVNAWRALNNVERAVGLRPYTDEPKSDGVAADKEQDR